MGGGLHNINDTFGMNSTFRCVDNNFINWHDGNPDWIWDSSGYYDSIPWSLWSSSKYHSFYPASGHDKPDNIKRYDIMTVDKMLKCCQNSATNCGIFDPNNATIGKPKCDMVMQQYCNYIKKNKDYATLQIQFVLKNNYHVRVIIIIIQNALLFKNLLVFQVLQ